MPDMKFRWDIEWAPIWPVQPRYRKDGRLDMRFKESQMFARGEMMHGIIYLPTD
jgi:hypothetical protein